MSLASMDQYITMQFHRKTYLLDFGRIFAWTFLNFLAHYDTENFNFFKDIGCRITYLNSINIHILLQYFSIFSV